jgi:adenosylhomocysteine nucleosidase
MLQSLLRNWLMGQARQKMRDAAVQAASEAAGQAKPADEQEPPTQRRNVCHVGLVFALGIEAGGLVDRLKGVIRTEGRGFSAREGGLEGRRLVVVESGAGSQLAARATDALIAGHAPRWVISAGFAGGLHESLAQGDILVPDQIVDASGRQLEIDFKLDREATAAQRHLHVGRLLTAERVICDPREKQALGETHAALAVDMESIAVAQVCRKAKTQFLAVRIISDAVGHELPKDIDHLVKQRSMAGRLGAAAGAIVRRPSSVKDMWQLKEDALVASERLAKFLVGIIAQLPESHSDD